jgi:hypothetical protein
MTETNHLPYDPTRRGGGTTGVEQGIVPVRALSARS